MNKINMGNIKKIAIIGSGPAGISCAHYLIQKGYNVNVFEAEKEIGGVLVSGIPSYRLPREELNKDLDYLKKKGIKFKTNTKIGKDISFKKIRQTHDSVFISVGLKKNRELHIPGIDIDKMPGQHLKGIILGGDFLEKVNSNKNTNIGNKIIVIGGGNVAIDVARSAKRLGSDVTIACLESRENMPAIKSEIIEAEKEGIKILNSIAPVRYTGSKKNVSGMKFIKIKKIDFDEFGRLKPIFVKGSEFIINSSSVITAIGYSSDLGFIDEKDGPRITKKNNVEVNEFTLQTSIPGVFAGGDCVTGPTTVIKSMGMGKRAGFMIERYLKNERLEASLPVKDLADKEKLLHDIETKKRDMELNTKRVKEQELSLEERKSSFKEVQKGYSNEEAIEEARRCMACGGCADTYEFVDDRCKDCSNACPMFEFPQLKDENINCNLCMECVKACRKDNIQVSLKTVGKDIWSAKERLVDESSKAVILFGVVLVSTAVMVAPWEPFQNLVASWFGIVNPNIAYGILYVIISVILPVSMFFGAAYVAKIWSKSKEITSKNIYTVYGYMSIPVGLSMHLAHNLNHLFLEASSIIPAIQRFAKLNFINLGNPNFNVAPLLGSSGIFWLQMLTMFLGYVIALIAGYKISQKFYHDKRVEFRILVPMLIITIIFMVINLYVLGLPMSMRHHN